MDKEISSNKMIQYFSDNTKLSEKERHEIFLWLQQNPDFGRYISGTALKVDVNSAKNHLMNRISNCKKTNSEKSPDIYNKKSLIYHLSRSLKLSGRLSGVAAVFVILTLLVAISVSILYIQNVRTTDESEFATFVTNRGEFRNLILEDGSEILLGVDSRLSYSRGFSGKSRDIYLMGEAFFYVSSGDGRKFIVHTEGTLTEVVGTSFSIRSYPEDPEIEVLVAEGKVSFRAEKSDVTDGVILAERQLGRIAKYDMSEIAVKSDVNLNRLLSWKEGVLVFQDAVLGDMISSLERWYNIDIHLSDESLKQRHFTGTFRNESIAEVLQILAISLDINYDMQDKRVLLYP